ncbi:hypothetical protein ACHQM5_018463 [Ranunculus cassubicifolius]
MEGEGFGYVPPKYIPLWQSELQQRDVDDDRMPESAAPQWTSGICACCDDIHSCCIGVICPCYLFGKNAEYLGSGTLVGSCMTHCILWGLVNALCCLLTGGGALIGLPGGCFVACYACGYRRTLRAKYNLPDAPCGDLGTHLFCHVCAVCQEHREIRDRSQDDIKRAQVKAPSIQTMESSASPKK